MEKLVIEIDELCQLLDIGKNTAYSLLTSGEINAFKIGTIWKIPIKSVEKYINFKCEQRKNKIEMCQIVK